jgi:hypothetical protein
MQTLIMEHKTTSEDCGLGSLYWQVLCMDAQISTYHIGARALGHDPDGVLYDVLRKPQLRPALATPEGERKYTRATAKEPSRLYAGQRIVDETPAEYLDRCSAAIAADPDRYYQRGIVVRLASEERDAAADLWQTADAIRVSQNTGRWPRNVDSCRNYGRLCDYFPICSGVVAEDDPRYEQVEAHSELASQHHSLPLLTVSSARCYRACARKYKLKYIASIRARIEADALGFGTLIHKGLEAWLISRDLDVALEAMRAMRDSYAYDDAKAEAMLRGYHARWGQESLEVVSVEQQFVTPLVNPTTGVASRTFLLAGKLDGIVRREDI